MKLILRQVFLIVLTSLTLSTAWAGANVYNCSQVGGRGEVEIRIQNLIWGKYVKLSDLRDGGFGPKYDYDYTELNPSPAGLPQGSYVLVTTGVLGLVLDRNMYNGSAHGIAAETEHNSISLARVYQCQLN